MEKPSGMIWELLGEQSTRGDAMKLFADAVLATIPQKDQNRGNGYTVDALESALNILCEQPERFELLKKWIETEE